MVRGFVLITTLIIILMISMIALSGFRIQTIHLHAQSDKLYQEMINIEAKKMLDEIEENLLIAINNCLVKRQSAKIIASMPDSFWFQSPCRSERKSSTFFYVLEALGHHPCSMIISASGQRFSSRYYRISLAGFNKASNKGSLLLQRTIAVKGITDENCDEKPYAIHEGQQMQRQLIRQH